MLIHFKYEGTQKRSMSTGIYLCARKLCAMYTACLYQVLESIRVSFWWAMHWKKEKF